MPESRTRFPVGTILKASLVVGVLDLAYVTVLWVVALKRLTFERLLQSIATGLVGRASYDGGTRTAVLGAICPFTIATIWSLLFYLLLRRSPWLQRQMNTTGGVLKAGMIYGVFVWLFMDFVVLTISLARMTSVHSWPFWVNLPQHALMVGLPIAWIVGRQQALGSD